MTAQPKPVYPSWIYDEYARRAKPPQPVKQPAPQPAPAPAFLTVHEVAALLRVSPMTIYRRVHEAELPHVKIGRSFRIPRKAVDEFIDGQLS